MSIERLTAGVQNALGRDDVSLKAASGGAGNLAFEVLSPAGDAVAFLRAKMGDGGLAHLGYSLAREGEVLKVASSLGFPVAAVIATFDDPDALLMEVVAGTSRADEEQTEIVAPQYMALIARLHATDATPFPVQRHVTMRDAVAADLAMWAKEGAEKGVTGDALMALTDRVLHELLPDTPGAPALVHGDVGPGNFMCRDGEITAMLDWELAHLGDPHEDLAWMWMRGAHTAFGDPHKRIAEYARASGRPIDDARIGWHLAVVMWKSVVAVRSRLRAAIPGELAMVQEIVRVTYESLLAAQLVRLLGGSLPLLRERPERVAEPAAVLAEELLAVATLDAPQRVVVEYLRDSVAQRAWADRCLDTDCRGTLGIAPGELTAFVPRCDRSQLLETALVIGRDVDRRSMAMPRAGRRIERAMGIGLGV